MCLPYEKHFSLPLFVCYTELPARRDSYIPCIITEFVQMVPNLSWLDLTIFNFTLVQKQHTFGRNLSSNSEFWSFPELAVWASVFSCDSGQAEPPGSHVIRKVSNRRSDSHFVPIQALFFTFTTAFNELHEIVNILL